MRGVKPKGLRLRLLENGVGVQAAPECPDWLSPDARAEWARVVPPLAARFELTPVDVGMLAAYCQTYANWRRAEVQLARDGHTFVDRHGDTKLNPLAGYVCRTAEMLRRQAAEFGFTPASRERMGAPANPPETDPDEDDFGERT